MSECSIEILWNLFATSEPAGLGPERRNATRAEAQVRATVQQAFRSRAVSESHKQLVLSLMLLWHDHLDASHLISQGIETPDGSFLHAVMHRREPDYWNSKYWWRKTGQHPTFLEIGERVGAHFQTANHPNLQQTLLPNGIWNPGAFVDACEAASGRALDHPRVMELCKLQQIELEVLLRHLTSV